MFEVVEELDEAEKEEPGETGLEVEVEDKIGPAASASIEAGGSPDKTTTEDEDVEALEDVELEEVTDEDPEDLKHNFSWKPDRWTRDRLTLGLKRRLQQRPRSLLWSWYSL